MASAQGVRSTHTRALRSSVERSHERQHSHFFHHHCVVSQKVSSL
jgi:hypothetical protein